MTTFVCVCQNSCGDDYQMVATGYSVENAWENYVNHLDSDAQIHNMSFHEIGEPMYYKNKIVRTSRNL